MFVSAALGGPNPYKGKSMRAAHKGMGLTDDHFDAVVDELTNAMDEMGVEEKDIEAVIGTVEGLRDDVLDK
jgi:hemoglobin